MTCLTRFVHASRAIDNDVAVVADQQIKQARKLSGCRYRGIGLLRASQQMKAVLGRGHQTFEQGSVHAVQVLQGIHDAECGAGIQMQRGVTDR